MKTLPQEFALHDWIAELPFTQQAVLMSATRGADGLQKDTPSKRIVAYIRGVCIKPAYEWDGTNDNSYMWGDYSVFEQHAGVFFSDVDSLPHHFFMHLIHAAEIIGYNHPNLTVRENWIMFYKYACKSFHMLPETIEQLNFRLNH